MAGLSPEQRRSRLAVLMAGGRFGRDDRPEGTIRIGRGGIPLSAHQNFRATFWDRSGTACSDPAGAPAIIADPPLPKSVVPDEPFETAALEAQTPRSEKLTTAGVPLSIDTVDELMRSGVSATAFIHVATTIAP